MTEPTQSGSLLSGRRGENPDPVWHPCSVCNVSRETSVDSCEPSRVGSPDKRKVAGSSPALALTRSVAQLEERQPRQASLARTVLSALAGRRGRVINPWVAGSSPARCFTAAVAQVVEQQTGESLSRSHPLPARQLLLEPSSSGYRLSGRPQGQTVRGLISPAGCHSLLEQHNLSAHGRAEASGFSHNRPGSIPDGRPSGRLAAWGRIPASVPCSTSLKFSREPERPAGYRPAKGHTLGNPAT